MIRTEICLRPISLTTLHHSDTSPALNCFSLFFICITLSVTWPLATIYTTHNYTNKPVIKTWCYQSGSVIRRYLGDSLILTELKSSQSSFYISRQNTKIVSQLSTIYCLLAIACRTESSKGKVKGPQQIGLNAVHHILAENWIKVPTLSPTMRQ